MNFRKTVRSTYQHQSQHESLKKMEFFIEKRDFNPDDLKECNNLYTEEAQSTKESESNSILNRLLLQPPSMKQNSQKKLSLLQNKKYEPKFQKPDVENVIQENINLKNIIQSNNHTISTLKVKNIELEKKIKLLEKGLEKFEKKIFGEGKNRNEEEDEKEEKESEKKSSANNSNEERSMGQTISGASLSKTGPIHTEILKKKISELTQMNMEAENELKFLKKLPNATIYEENDVEKEHLMAETIRLKSIITSLSEELHQINQNESNEKFQNQFMRLMKEENEKLKATVRLLENDKILLKSRQAIMNKLNSDLKKEIEQLKSKLLYKESELEKINNENKNLLFKKTNQYKLEQEKKENEIISELRQKLTIAENEITKLEQSNEFYNDENISLKEKEKNLQQELTELETKYESLVKKLNDENEELQFELKNVKNDYLNLLNSNALKKKKSVAILMQQNNNGNQKSYGRKESGFSLNINVEENKRNSQFQQEQMEIDYNSTNMNSVNKNFNSNFTLKRQKSLNQYYNLQHNEFVYARPVKWEEIQLPLTHLYHSLRENNFISISTIIEKISEDDKIKCGDLISLFVDEPFKINKKEGTKLARYIVEEETSGNERVMFSENAIIELSLAKRIIISSLEKVNEKLTENHNERWKIIFDKTKKIVTILREWLEDKEFVKKEELMEIIEKYSRQKVEIEDYDFLCTKCFDKNHSEEEFTLDKIMVLEWLDDLMRSKPKEQQSCNYNVVNG